MKSQGDRASRLSFKVLFGAGALVLGLAAPATAADTDPYKGQKNLGELWIYGGVFLPSTSHEFYRPSTSTWGELGGASADFGLRGGFFPHQYFGGEAELGLMPSSKDGGGSPLLWTARAHVVGQYQMRVTPFIVAGLGAIGVSSGDGVLGNDTDLAFHWGLGAKYAINQLLNVRLDARHIVAPARDGVGQESNTSHFEILAAFGVTFGRPPEILPDPDKDGIRGDADKCPNKSGVAPDGCPLPDGDEDGVPDKDDECPNEEGDKPTGCPKDSDLDGVPDLMDKCPTVAGKDNGCPADADKDGVPDDKDKCVDVKGLPEHEGCPDPDPDKDGVDAANDKCPDEAGVAPHGCPDQDNDGVADKDDQCKTEPETKNGFKDADGCPDEIPKIIRKFTGAIKGIYFKSGSSEIAPTSFRTLNRAVKVLKDFETIRLEISGHTDDQGGQELNQKLSQERADAVKAYFVAQGVVADRLVAKGYGPDQPVASNRTSQGRAQNRRIEFQLLTD